MQIGHSILIVDSEVAGRAQLRRALDSLNGAFPHRVLDEVSDAQSAIERIDALHPEVLLVDAVLPGMSGIELVRRLTPPAPPARPPALPVPPPSVIFVSGSARYAVDAFEVKAIDYLLKPVEAPRLLQALRRVDEKPASPSPVVSAPAALPAEPEPPRAARRHFAVHERGRLMLVPVEQVIYLKAELKYVTVRTRQREYLIEDSLSSLEAEFGGHFVRVHRNALVARPSIAGFERVAAGPDDSGDARWQVVLRDVPERLPVSRRQWSSLRTLIG